MIGLKMKTASADFINAARANGLVVLPAGDNVVRMLPPGNVKVRFFVPEPLLSSLRMGQRLPLRCDGCPPELVATVSFIASEAEFTPPVIYNVGNREKLVFMAEARPVAEAGLHPGQPVDLALAPTRMAAAAR